MRELVLAGTDRLYVAGLTAHVAYDHIVEDEPECEWWDWWCKLTSNH